MESLLRKSLARLSAAPGVALVIGAGAGSCLPALRAAAFQKIVLVEANPLLAQQLAARISPQAGEQVLQAAVVATDASEGELHVLANPAASSAVEPTALFEAFPNLRVTQHLQVPARSMQSMQALLAGYEDSANLLLLDAPGLSVALVNAAGPELLAGFTQIIVHGSMQGLYKNEQPVESARSVLECYGFECTGTDPEDTPPRCSLGFSRNARVLERLTQIREREAIDQALSTAQGQLVASQKQVDDLQRQLDERASLLEKLQQERIQLVQQGKQSAAQLAAQAELQARCEQLQQDKVVIEQQRKDAEARQQKLAADSERLLVELAASQKLAANLQSLLDERNTRLEKLQQEHTLLSQRGEQSAALLAAAQKAQAELQTRCEQLQKDKATLDQQRKDAEARQQKQATDSEKQLAELKGRFDQLQKDKAAADKTVLERQQQLLDKQRNAQRGELEVEEVRARAQFLQQELLRAEGQLQLLRSLLLQEPSL